MSIGKIRGGLAVVAVTGLLAGMLVAVPAATAVDSVVADYTATFQACPPGATPAYQFNDVPSSHPNANDIACIAYYGITKGTTHTTYSPSTPVTRWQMALFLTRLADRVGITVPQPGPISFTDTGGLEAETQQAISQLAQMGVTKGTTGSTFSPGQPVTRGQMALLIQRLMNQMTPMEGHGYIPSQVNLVNSPFRDVRTMNTEYREAIGRLWNMGVITGSGNVIYDATAPITRNTMARYITGVLDHSNARPEGLTIQSDEQILWGTQTVPLVAVSYRDKNFQPLGAPVTVDVFSSKDANVTTCSIQSVTGDCVWRADDRKTNYQGNILVEESIPIDSSKTFYAWIGTENNQKFSASKVDYRTATVSVEYPEDAIVIGTTLNHNTLVTDRGKPVNYNDVSEVLVIGALRSNTGATWVERPGLRVNVRYEQGNRYTEVTDYVTDKWGRVSFKVTSPNQARTDRFVFTLYNEASQMVHQSSETWNWTNENALLSSDSVQVNSKAGADGTEVSITVSVWDQYGVPWTKDKGRIRVVIWIDDDQHFDERTETGDKVMTKTLTADQGSVTWSTIVNASPGEILHVKYDVQYLNGSNVDTYIDRATPASRAQQTDGTAQIPVPSA